MTHIVLAGAGHAHLYILKRAAEFRRRGIALPIGNRRLRIASGIVLRIGGIGLRIRGTILRILLASRTRERQDHRRHREKKFFHFVPPRPSPNLLTGPCG